MRTALSALLGLVVLAAGAAPAAGVWRPSRTVIVVLENRSFHQVIDNPEMRFVNELAAGAALMTRAYFAQTPYTGNSPAGLPARPSQPNYLYLFSGDAQGILPPWMGGVGNGPIPAARRPFLTPNLGAALIESGATYAGFSESLPYPHWDGAGDRDPLSDLYRRKHNPTVNWVNLTGAEVDPATRRFLLQPAANLGFARTRDPVDDRDYRGFAVDERGAPLGYEKLPTVSIVVPNEQNDAHSGSATACDTWLQQNIGPFAAWARAHDGLLILTFDEDGSTSEEKGDAYRTGIDRIPTLFYGPPDKVIPGRYDEKIDHLNVLGTVLERYGLLEKFREDFRASHDSPESAVELENLRPIRDVFGEGPPLPALDAR